MPVSTDVTLPRDYLPNWPDMCIVCHQTPDASIAIAHNAQNPLLTFFTPLLYLFGWSRIKIPICQGCKLRFRWQRWGRELVLWGLLTIAVFIAMPQFDEWPALTRKLVVAGFAILAISPWIVAELFWPRVFDTTANKHTVEYQFASAEYAREFLVVNWSEVAPDED